MDANTGELTGPGSSERLDPKVVQVLLVLAVHAGAVVPRETIHDSVWRDCVVTDHALSRCIYQLRRHLERAGATGVNELVETLPKRGYRLNATVTACPPAEPARADAAAEVPAVVLPAGASPSAVAEPAAPPSPPPAGVRHRSLRLMLVLAAALGIGLLVLYRSGVPFGEEPEASGVVATLAVLPFADMSAARDHGYLADGLAEEILDVLNRVRDIRVIARSSSFAFRHEHADLATIAARLGASHLVEGSVRVSGERVRVTARLVEAAGGLQLWSASYHRDLHDVFALESEIAASVAGALEVRLARGTVRALAGAPLHPAAEEQYLHARYFHNRRDPGDQERALQHYRRAVVLDPNHARAWVGLAGIYILQLADSAVGNPAVELEKLGEAVHRAVTLDPRLPAARARQSQYLAMTGDADGAARAISAALALVPDDALTLAIAAGVAAADGRWDEVIRLQRRAVRLDPVAIGSRNNLAVWLLQANRLEEADREFLVIRELMPDLAFTAGGPPTAVNYATLLILQRRYDEALDFVGRWPGSVERQRLLAMIYHGLGRGERADALLRQPPAPRHLGEWVSLADVYAFRGDNDRAFRWLASQTEHLLASPGLLGPHKRWWLRQITTSPFLAALHDDARWQGWVASSTAAAAD